MVRGKIFAKKATPNTFKTQSKFQLMHENLMIKIITAKKHVYNICHKKAVKYVCSPEPDTFKNIKSIKSAKN